MLSSLATAAELAKDATRSEQKVTKNRARVAR